MSDPTTRNWTIDYGDGSIPAARQEWHKAWAAAWAAIPSIGKDRSVSAGSYDYSYATLASIVDQIRPALTGNGLSVAQSVESTPTHVAVETRIYHVGGHVERFGPLLLPASGDARSIGSAITYARRYALLAALGIAPDEDDDGAAASKPARQSKPRGSKAEPKPETVDLHEKAWQATLTAIRDAGGDASFAEAVFIDALAVAGVKRKIVSVDQEFVVMAEVRGQAEILKSSREKP